MNETQLKQAGLKSTPRRRAMLQLLSEAERPLTAEEIFEKLGGEASCSLSTVYRALHTMTEHHLLQKSVHQDGVIYYQLTREDHHHRLVCIRCRESVPIDLCPLEQLEQNLSSDTGYQITGHRFEISGICPKCAKELEKEGK